MAFSTPKNSAEAHRLKVYAQSLRSAARCFEEDGKADRVELNLMEAEAAEKAADKFLCVHGASLIGAGGELVPVGEKAADLSGIVDTVQHPDVTTQEASLKRIELADGAGAFTMALDLAETIKADNSLEKAMAHQMAAAHVHAMKLLAEADRQKFSADKVRLTNAAARLMTAFQEGASTIAKLRSGGQQKVTVVHQHVQVAGGQVAVTGAIERKSGDEK